MSILDKLRAILGGRAENGAAAHAANGQEGSGAMISCEEALQRIQEYLDGELDEASECDVRAHFEVCQRCYPHLRFESSFREALRRATTCESTPQDLKARVTALLEDARSEG